MFFLPGGQEGNLLFFQVDFQLCLRILASMALKMACQKFFGHLNRQQAVVEGIILENIGKKAGYHRP